MSISNLLFVNVNPDYLKALHDVDHEVQYSSIGYDTKPFIGVLILRRDTKYVIPLSSAKPKHLSWKDKNADGRYLVADIIKRDSITPDTIYKEINSKDFVKRVYASLDVKKMVPVRDGLYSVISLDISNDDNKETRDYKILQEKEYKACVKIFQEVSERAKLIYEKQIQTGRVQRYCCNFTLLERVMEAYAEQVN